jgi:hypothetical protein
MLYAWIDGVKRPPLAKGERTICDCGGLLTSVIPVENVRHWRHKAGDCDPWSEPEGPWHLGWKEQFDLSCREISLIDPATGERHRADVLCGPGTSRPTVLELQHSSISEEERAAREAFYRQEHRMFWLVHLHDEKTFTGTYFRLSLGMSSRSVNVDGHTFAVRQWVGRTQFIEKWKRATAHVFFDYQGHIFFLAGEALSRRLGGGAPLEKGEFALCHMTREDFIRAVAGPLTPAST